MHAAASIKLWETSSSSKLSWPFRLWPRIWHASSEKRFQLTLT